MQQFDLTLKNEKIKSYRAIALLIVIINISLFILSLFKKVYFFETAAALFLIAVYGLYRFYVSKKTKTRFFVDEFSLFLLAGSWLELRNYFFAVACVFLGILYHLSLQKLRFIFTEEFVKKMNFPKVEYSWNAFENVMLRDNILTLDFSDNKLIQIELEKQGSIDEEEFNGFANKQLFKSSHPEKSIYLN